MKAGRLCRKAAALFFVLVFICGLSVFVHATYEEIENVQSEKEEDEQRLASTGDRIAALEEARSSSETYLSELSSQISDLTDELIQVNEKLNEKESELAEIEEEILLLENDADQQYEDMKLRIQYLYENGAAAGTFVSMLSAGSFSEFLNRAENYSQLNRFDREMLQNYEETLSTIEDRKNTLLEEKEEILGIREELSERQAMIQELYEAAYNDMMSCIAELDGAQDEYYAIVEELQAKEDLMNELLRQQYEAEAAAALAEQQAAQAALEAENIPEEYYYEEEPAEEISAPEAPAPEQPEPVYEETSTEENPAEEPVSEEVNEPEESSEESEVPSEESQEPSGETNGDMTYLGNFMITAYCPCAQCCGAYATGYTASGTLATEGVTVAMGGVEFGTKLCIDGHIYTVEDRGTAYGHVDIFFSDHASALAFGLKYADVYIVN